MDYYASVSFSQEGEDIVLRQLLSARAHGVYVDVGAHHPSRFSNTRLLYDRGWSGLNIDALPGSMVAFQKKRPRDINLEVGVGSLPGIATYWQFVEPAVSTFDEAIARDRIASGLSLKRQVDVQVKTLSSLIDENLGSRAIDLLSVDVEGRDLDVLESLDWARQRPAIVCVESSEDVSDVTTGPAGLLREHGYALYAATGLSRIFRSSDM